MTMTTSCYSFTSNITKYIFHPVNLLQIGHSKVNQNFNERGDVVLDEQNGHGSTWTRRGVPHAK
jgi:hypothetical protein